MPRPPLAKAAGALMLFGIIALLPTAAAQTASADLSISKTDSADPVAVGGSFTYNITVSNAGPSKADNIVITDALPAGVTFVSAPGSCTHSSGSVTCTRNNLNAGQSFTVAITVQATTVGNWTNNVTVSASTADPVTTNNVDSEVTSVVTVAPSGLTCFADPAGVHLDWDDTPQATGYNVYRATGAGSFVFLDSAATSSYLDSSAAVGQSYRYRVTALSAGGESAPSAECTIASVPVFPGALAGALALVGSLVAFVALRRR